MTSSSRNLFLGIVLLAATTAAHAQVAASKLVSKEIALEVPAASMVLPMSSTSAAVFPPCGGCAPKSYPTTAATRYYLSQEQVTVADLKAAIIGRPSLMLTVMYSPTTGELISVTADVPAPRVNTAR